MEWVTEHWDAFLMPLWFLLGGALLTWLRRFFPPKGQVDNLSKTFKEYILRHEDEHKEMESRLNEGDARFTRLEQSLKNLPSKDDLHQLEMRVERFNGDIRVAAEVLKRVEVPLKAIVESALMDKNHE